MDVKFFDFAGETAAIGAEITRAVSRVINSGHFVLGPELERLEGAFAALCGCKYAAGVASGTDALFLALKAMGIGPGHEVITVANTFAATALAIIYTGATPVFVDIEPDSHLIDPQRIREALTERTRAIIPVHLYGRCADMDAIMEIAAEKDLYVLEDACQAHGAHYKGRPAGSLGHAAAFSFYPTKNLGAYGDAGIITTNDKELHEKIGLLRNYGQRDRYTYDLAGYNSRLDEIQAAVLNVKLPLLESWIAARRRKAQIYDRGLPGISAITDKFAAGSDHTYYLYVITVPQRDALRDHLAQKGIGTLIHYPVPLDRQPAFKNSRVAGSLANTYGRTGMILSLPMHPWLKEAEVEYVCEAVRDFYA